MRFKRAAAGSAAAFIAIMTVAIIMYIMFLPPDVRENLLNDGSSGGGVINTNRSDLAGYTSTLLDEKVGTVEYLNTNSRTYVLPTSRVYAPTSSQVLKTVASAMTKNAFRNRL